MHKRAHHSLLYICLLLQTACAPAEASSQKHALDISLGTPLDSEQNKVGDPVRGTVVHDVRAGHRLIAPAGSVVSGHVTEVSHRRRLLHAELSTHRWLRAGGNIAMEFDRLTPPHGSPVKIKALPAQILSVPSEHAQQEPSTVVTKHGVIEAKRKKDMVPKATRAALGIGAFFAAPVTATVGGIAGAVKPSTVLPESDDPKSKHHRHLKGMATGVMSGLPGGFLIGDTILKGQHAAIKPGTRIRLESTFL
jgi:hypothetical protein